MTAATRPVSLPSKGLFTAAQHEGVHKFDTTIALRKLPEVMIQQIQDGVVDMSHRITGNLSAVAFHATYAALHGEGKAPQRLIAVKKTRKGNYELAGWMGFGDETQKAVTDVENFITDINPEYLFNMMYHTDAFVMETPTLPTLYGTRGNRLFELLNMATPQVRLQHS